MRGGGALAAVRRGLSAFAVVAALGLGAVAHADPFEGEAVVASADLADARGGYMSAGGISFGFGAVVRTFANDELALESTVTWAPTGIATQSSGGPQFQVADVPGLLSSVIATSGGASVAHSFDSGLVRNIIVNSADGQAFRQEVEVTITLPGFEATQQGIDLARLGMRINADVSDGIAGR